MEKITKQFMVGPKASRRLLPDVFSASRKCHAIHIEWTPPDGDSSHHQLAMQSMLNIHRHQLVSYDFSRGAMVMVSIGMDPAEEQLFMATYIHHLVSAYMQAFATAILAPHSDDYKDMVSYAEVIECILQMLGHSGWVSKCRKACLTLIPTPEEARALGFFSEAEITAYSF